MKAYRPKRPRRSRDPIATKRKRPKRVAKRLARRLGMKHFRGASWERFSRHARAFGVAAANVLNRLYEDRLAAGLIVSDLDPQSETAKPTETNAISGSKPTP